MVEQKLIKQIEERSSVHAVDEEKTVQRVIAKAWNSL